MKDSTQSYTDYTENGGNTASDHTPKGYVEVIAAPTVVTGEEGDTVVVTLIPSLPLSSTLDDEWLSVF